MGLQNKERKGMLFIITCLFIYDYYYYNPALGRLYVMERRVLLGTSPNFSIHFLLILGPVSQNPHYNTTKNAGFSLWLETLAGEDFPPKLPWSKNADLKCSEESVNKKLQN